MMKDQAGILIQMKLKKRGENKRLVKFCLFLSACMPAPEPQIMYVVEDAHFLFALSSLGSPFKIE